MTTTVGDVIKMLQEVDPETPFFVHVGGGEFAPLNQSSESVHMKWFGTIELAKIKSDEEFYVWTKDAFYKKHAADYEAPFKAVTFLVR